MRTFAIYILQKKKCLSVFAIKVRSRHLENIQHRRFANGASRVCLLTPALIERERERARREIDRERRERGRGRWRRWYVDRGEEEARWAVQSMRCTRQKTMSRGGGQTGGKNTRRGPEPRRCGPLVWTTLPLCPSRSLRAHDAVYMRAAYALCGFADCIHEYRVHRDRKDESAIVRAGDVEKRNQRGLARQKYLYIIFFTRTCDSLENVCAWPL